MRRSEIVESLSDIVPTPRKDKGCGAQAGPRTSAASPAPTSPETRYSVPRAHATDLRGAPESAAAPRTATTTCQMPNGPIQSRNTPSARSRRSSGPASGSNTPKPTCTPRALSWIQESTYWSVACGTATSEDQAPTSSAWRYLKGEPSTKPTANQISSATTNGIAAKETASEPSITASPAGPV